MSQVTYQMVCRGQCQTLNHWIARRPTGLAWMHEGVAHASHEDLQAEKAVEKWQPLCDYGNQHMTMATSV